MGIITSRLNAGIFGWHLILLNAICYFYLLHNVRVPETPLTKIFKQVSRNLCNWLLPFTMLSIESIFVILFFYSVVCLLSTVFFVIYYYLVRCYVGSRGEFFSVMQVVANQKFIETRRKTVSFSVSDTQNIQIWETQVIRKRWTGRKSSLI